MFSHNCVIFYYRFEGVYRWIHPSLLGTRSIMATKAILVQRGSRHWSLERKQTLRYRRWKSARARYSDASLLSQRHRRRRRAFSRPNKYTSRHSQDEVSVSSLIRDVVQLVIARGIPTVQQSIGHQAHKMLISSMSCHLILALVHYAKQDPCCRFGCYEIHGKSPLMEWQILVQCYPHS